MRTMTVNGAETRTERSTLTFHDLLRIAFGDAYDSREKLVVTYEHAGPDDVAGRLIAGEAIRVVEGMAFTVARAPNPAQP